jgi:hypothetical protein
MPAFRHALKPTRIASAVVSTLTIGLAVPVHAAARGMCRGMARLAHNVGRRFQRQPNPVPVTVQPPELQVSPADTGSARSVKTGPLERAEVPITVPVASIDSPPAPVEASLSDVGEAPVAPTLWMFTLIEVTLAHEKFASVLSADERLQQGTLSHDEDRVRLTQLQAHMNRLQPYTADSFKAKRQAFDRRALCESLQAMETLVNQLGLGGVNQAIRDGWAAYKTTLASELEYAVLENAEQDPSTGC